MCRFQSSDLNALTSLLSSENDLGEIAQFIAKQSRRTPGNSRSASALVPA